MEKNLVDEAKDIISKILYITIATVNKNGEPWNSPVFSAFDENYNFYWNSWTESQHSKNIETNNNVFIVIYDSTVAEGTGKGVYVKAKARKLGEENEINKGYELLTKRRNKLSSKLRTADDFLEGNPRQIYKAVPERVWVNGNGEINGEFIDTRTEIKLI